MKNFKVLIADDIPSNVGFISNLLENEEYEVLIATNGVQAYEVATKNLPDLILLDIAMPEMDGYEVCSLLKAEPKTAETPIIFLTAKVEYADIVKGFEVGAVDYVLKPFNSLELLSRVKTHLDLKSKTEQLKSMNLVLEEKVQERTQQLTESNKQLSKLNEELKEANKKLSKLDQIKNDFIRHINHELRTPLQGIHGYIMLLNEIITEDDPKEYIKSISNLVQRLIKLAELSLLFSELRAKNYELKAKPIGVGECISYVISQANISEKGLDIVTKGITEDLIIEADKKLICSTLNIILDNAIKYSPVDGQIIIHASKSEDNMAIEVLDQGPGFSEKSKEQLFELFSADNLGHRSYGFGIGLATAKLILDNVKGNLKIENKKEGGAEVSIILPLVTEK